MENDSKKIIKFDIEKIILILLGLSFFVGTWHAFPMLNVINDEMYYVGGVLRAMENHTIVPAVNDVPYGTLTYFFSYAMSLFFLAVLAPFFKFSPSAIKLFLVESPWVMYFCLRILSALFSLAALFFVYGILKKEFEDKKIRLFLIVLLFTNIITTVVLHTGKMWVLSTLLVVISFHYLYKSVAHKDDQDRTKSGRNIFLSIMFAFLAFSNFPLNIFSLINLPLLAFFFRRDRELLRKIVIYTAIGACVFALVTLFNFASIKNQVISIFTDYHPIGGDFVAKLGFTSSLLSYIKKLLFLFPLPILTLLLLFKNKIKNINLLAISSFYFFSYFFLLVVVANYTLDLQSSLRYLFPLSFFLIFIIASFQIKFKKHFYVIGAISVFYFILALYYMSIPTTYNDAYGWVGNNLGGKKVLIVNNVSELQLTKNKRSALIVEDKFCATKCKNIIDYDLNKNFEPFVVDKDSKAFDLTKVKEEIYYIEEKQITAANMELIQSFTNPSPDYHSVDYNMGSYFDWDFLRLNNLGKDIYIYKKILQPKK